MNSLLVHRKTTGNKSAQLGYGYSRIVHGYLFRKLSVSWAHFSKFLANCKDATRVCSEKRIASTRTLLDPKACLQMLGALCSLIYLGARQLAFKMHTLDRSRIFSFFFEARNCFNFWSNFWNFIKLVSNPSPTCTVCKTAVPDKSATLHGIEDGKMWKTQYICASKKCSKFLLFLCFNLMTFGVYFKFTGTSSTLGPICIAKTSHLQVLHNLLLSPRPLPVRQDVDFVHFNDFQVQNISQYLVYCIWKPQIITNF